MPDRLTREDIARIAKLHAESTPGEWRADFTRVDSGDGTRSKFGAAIVLDCRDGKTPCLVQLPHYVIGPETPEEEARCKADYEFMATAHQDVPRLLADLAYWRSTWASVTKADCMLLHGGSIATCPQERGDCAEARAILEETK